MSEELDFLEPLTGNFTEADAFAVMAGCQHSGLIWLNRNTELRNERG